MEISPEVKKYVDELYQQGFTCLPALYSAEECQQMRHALDDYWKQQGSPALSANGGFGFAIHPLLLRIPQFAPFLDRQLLVEVTGAALKERPRLMHMGARISGLQSLERIHWHHHVGWDAKELESRDRIDSVAIFDTALWHAAQRGNDEKMTRRLWGCHIQGWSEMRPHPEDNDVNVPAITPYKSQYAGVRTFLGDS